SRLGRRGGGGWRDPQVVRGSSGSASTHGCPIVLVVVGWSLACSGGNNDDTELLTTSPRVLAGGKAVGSGRRYWRGRCPVARSILSSPPCLRARRSLPRWRRSKPRTTLADAGRRNPPIGSSAAWGRSLPRC